MKNANHNEKEKFFFTVIIILTLAVFAFSTKIFYCYINDIYASDFPSHIKTVLEGNPQYSLAHRLIGICYKFPHSNIVFSVVVGMLIIGTAIGMWLYISQRLSGGGTRQSGTLKKMSAIVAISLLFTSNIYIPVLFPAFYTHYTKVSQPWHNITYILMRFFAVFVIYMYFEVYDEAQNNRYRLRDCIWFWALLTLCNFSKPSFFLAFAPAVFCVLVICFLQAKGKNLIQSFQIGLPVLLSVPILFYQANIVYDESENSSIAFSLDCFLDYIFGKPGQIWVYEISNICFPMFVLVTLLMLKYVMHRTIELNRVGQGWLMFIIAHLQQLIMIDEGPRAASGNYAWGVYAFGMLLFMVCITDWITVYKNNLLKNKHIFRTGLCIYSLHILCGVIYFIKLCYGEKYIL